MTSAEALAAFAYYINNGGYYEKASSDGCQSNKIEYFAKNKGAGNYTWMGRLCGCNPGAWCAMMVSTAVYEAAQNNSAAAKSALWGRWPHYNCGTLFDDALAAGRAHYSSYQRSEKGRSGTAYNPVAGDVVIFSDDGTTRSHTGMVYACDGQLVYTYEGNSGNMARKRSYSLSDPYLYGFCTPLYDGQTDSGSPSGDGVREFQAWLGVETDGVYGPLTKKAAVTAHQHALNQKQGAGLEEDGVWGPLTYYATGKIQNGDEGDDVTVWQGLLVCRGQDPQGIDGQFGPNTLAATRALQKAEGLQQTGVADRYTWAKAFGEDRPVHNLLQYGSSGPEVAYLQQLLSEQGYVLQADGQFGPLTMEAVKQYQSEHGLEADGLCGPLTWASIE